MQALLAFSRLIDRLNARFAIVANYCVLVAVLISAGNAVMRYVLSYSSNAFLEVQWYLFAAMVMLGTSYTLKNNGHVRVDLIYSSVGDRQRLYIDLLGLIFFLLPVTGYLIYLTVPFFLASFRSGEMSMNAGGLILWPAKLMIPLGFILLALQGISELIKRIGALTGQVELDTHYEKPLQ
ncbi:TRAP transporter small permease subunit [Rhodoligotrophos defluvii]|uniref:TRAP transporter small permease subunit n=1 Tax=Rhodoligotrophos defluvii TaxID=2561934 RepID=UPI0010C99EC5|nr:TRAP transporter small permease subunit [Rhodoligotrophos defluvii]